MIATIAVIAEKKVQRSQRSEPPLSCDRSENDLWDRKSSISAIVVAAIAGEWFPYDRYMIAAIDRWTFFVEKYEKANWSLQQGDEEVNKRRKQTK